VRVSNALNAHRLRTPFLYILGALCLVYFSAFGKRGKSARGAPAVIVIRNATILTVSHGTLSTAPSLLRTAKSPEFGASINAPKDAQVIDAAGQSSCPALSIAIPHLAAESINEGSVSVSSMVNMSEILNPDDIDIYRDLAGGVLPPTFFMRLREFHRRTDVGHQASLGPARREAPVRRRGSRHQVALG